MPRMMARPSLPGVGPRHSTSQPEQSRRGALPEIAVHGETGLVVDEDPEALCDAWHRLLSDPERRREMGRAARRRAETHFSREHYAAAVESLYRETFDWFGRRGEGVGGDVP